MKTMQQSLDCQCGVKNSFRFRRCRLFESTIAKLTCGGCESEWEVKLTATPRGRNAYSAATRCAFVSPQLVAILGRRKNTLTREEALASFNADQQETKNGKEEV